MTRLGTGVSAARQVTMETQPRGHAVCARAHSALRLTGRCKKWRPIYKRMYYLHAILGIPWMKLMSPFSFFPPVLRWDAQRFLVGSSAYAEQATLATGVRGEFLYGEFIWMGWDIIVMVKNGSGMWSSSLCEPRKGSGLCLSTFIHLIYFFPQVRSWLLWRSTDSWRKLSALWL